jgi:histone H3/H4
MAEEKRVRVRPTNNSLKYVSSIKSFNRLLTSVSKLIGKVEFSLDARRKIQEEAEKMLISIFARAHTFMEHDFYTTLRYEHLELATEKLLKDAKVKYLKVDGISDRAIKRLARKGGCSRIAKTSFVDAQKILNYLLWNIIKAALDSESHLCSKRKTKIQLASVLEGSEKIRSMLKA